MKTTQPEASKQPTAPGVKASSKTATAATSSHARKGAVSYKDVPFEIKEKFMNIVVPLAKQLAGRQVAFSSVTASQVQELMDDTFPKLAYKAEEGDLYHRLVSDASILVQILFGIDSLSVD